MTRNEAYMLIAAHRYEEQDGDEDAVNRLRPFAFGDFGDILDDTESGDLNYDRLGALIRLHAHIYSEKD